MGIALIMLMAGFIKICSVHTPSSNPKLPPPKPLPGTVHHMFILCMFTYTLFRYIVECSFRRQMLHVEGLIFVVSVCRGS